MRKTIAILVWVLPICAMADDIREDFTSDPGWEGRKNRPDPSVCEEKVQDFGYSRTNHAGGKPGEIGGIISRSLTPAIYAHKIPERTLQDRLRASGRFAVTQADGNSTVMIGWFNRQSRGWRTPNSLVFRIDGEGDRFRILFEYGTRTLKTGGGTTFEGPYQTTRTPMLKADGTSHQWSLSYDPEAAKGLGEIIFTLDKQPYTCTLGEGHKAEGAVFDRFGIMNVQTSGRDMTLWLDDIELDGEREDFSKDPGWDGQGNRITFKDCRERPYHDFGWSDSNHAGGKPGEIGGIMWRIESDQPKYAGYYGASIGELSLKHELRASGKMSLRMAASDSAILIGWFNSLTPIGAAPPNFLGIMIEGPSAVGHYVRPTFRDSHDNQKGLGQGPIIRADGKSHQWELRFDPSAADGRGQITMNFDDQKLEMDLDEGIRKWGAVFDRFGAVSWHTGGHYVEIYFDDLTFTGKKEPEKKE